jgi:hypothetical protein
MKTDGNSPAFSKAAFYHPDGGINPPNDGLTKREYFAAMALQGLLTNNNKDYVYFVISAVEFADDLIEELSKTKTNEKK